MCVCEGESPESLGVVALGGLRRGDGCAQRRHRKRVKVRANWNHMSEATGRRILTAEQERQRGEFTPHPDCFASSGLSFVLLFASSVSHVISGSCSQKPESSNIKNIINTV